MFSIADVLAVILVILLIDLYFYRPVKSFFRRKRLTFYIYWSVSALSVISIVIATWLHFHKIQPGNFFHTYILGMILILVLSKIIGSIVLLIRDVVFGVKLLINKFQSKSHKKVTIPESNQISRGDFLKKAALVAGALPFGLLSYGMIDTVFDYQIRKATLNIDGFNGKFKGLRIVQISDIHTGSFLNANHLERVVRMANNLSPDIVFFTGDLVNLVSEEALEFISTLKQIRSKLGVFSILGNHDYGDYFYDKDDFKGKAHNRRLMIDIHKKLGWQLLLNQHVVLTINGQELAIVGVENWGKASRFPKRGNIALAQKGIENHPNKLLLTHDPTHWDCVVEPKFKDIKMTFSGHTHGLQFGIDLPNYKWSPAKYIYPEWAGLYKKNRQQIYVNRGIGFIGYPGRVGIRPEITVFEFA